MHLDYKMRGLSDHSFRLSQLTVVLCIDHLVIYLLLLLDFESPEGKNSSFLSFYFHSLFPGPNAYWSLRKCLVTCFGESRWQ